MKRPSGLVTRSPCGVWRGREIDRETGVGGGRGGGGWRGAYLLVWKAWQELGLACIGFWLQEVGAVSDVDIMVLRKIFVILVNPVALVAVALEIPVEVAAVHLSPVHILPLPRELGCPLLRLDGTMYDVFHIPGSLAATTSTLVRPYLLLHHSVEPIAQVMRVLRHQTNPD